MTEARDNVTKAVNLIHKMQTDAFEGMLLTIVGLSTCYMYTHLIETTEYPLS